jgi:AcrR family transcriptional regulator
MEVDARRSQLLEIGLELFGSRPYDEVWIGEIAEEAGISRGLLYHYFPTKRDFYVAVIREAAGRIWQLTEPDPGLSPMERLRAGIDAYLDQAEAQPAGYRTVHRGGVGSDEEVRRIVRESQARQAERILVQITGGKPPSETLRMAVEGWIAFQVAVCLSWLDHGSPPRDVLRELLAHALIGSVNAALQADPSVEVAIPDPTGEG